MNQYSFYEYSLDCDAIGRPRCEILDLLDFRFKILEMLVKPPRKRRSEACLRRLSDVSDDASI